MVLDLDLDSCASLRWTRADIPALLALCRQMTEIDVNRMHRSWRRCILAVYVIREKGLSVELATHMLCLPRLVMLDELPRNLHHRHCEEE